MDAHAGPVSTFRLWWRAEPRLDLWVSAGALTLGVSCVLAVLAL